MQKINIKFSVVILILLSLVITGCLKGRKPDEGASWMGSGAVYAWKQKVTIPTYEIGKPDKNPMFLEKRVYQGSSGVVYPNPVIDKVSDTKVDKQWNAIFLENKWIKLMILPELGGRLQMAMDKSNGYQFIYYNEVIKPALVGLCGPWISGGLEFNWPQHHRPSTFEPQDYTIEKNKDGSVTVWCGEIEKMFRTRGIHGFTLYPNKAVVEIKVKLYNRTSEAQTFLWWANPAVHVNDNYQSLFPPDVYAVMDHGKRAVSDFPIATGTYYKIDYSPGTDISMYKNIPVPTSFMAYHSDFNFIGCYDHGADAGMIHVANHYLVPGKKQWTWGTSDFGQAWDRQLTDENGPYIELMCGAFTDNQPDFSWLMPGEEKQFSQNFMPFQQIKGVKNASTEAALNLEVKNGKAFIGAYLTQPAMVTVELVATKSELKTLYKKTLKLAPNKALTENILLPDGIIATDLTLTISKGEEILLSYSPLKGDYPSPPQPAKAAPAPKDVKSNDLLYLTGLHLEQYRHATRSPKDYYLEAIKRDPGDARCNNAMGLLYYRRGDFKIAQSYFEKAISRLTFRNPNPYDGEAYYNLGLSLKMQQKLDLAYSAFYKACWNEQWKSASYFELARLDLIKGDYKTALSHLDRSLDRNQNHHKARHLKIAILRRMGEKRRAKREVKSTLAVNAMELGALYEQFLLKGDKAFFEISGSRVNTLQEIALDYLEAGFYQEAKELLTVKEALKSPLSLYYLGWIAVLEGDDEMAENYFAKADKADSYLCFPNHLESVLALTTAIKYYPQGAKAPYYLALYYYAHKKPLAAIKLWEKSAQLDSQFPTVHRNLALAYFNKLNDPQKALISLELAFKLDSTDPRLFFELDQLYKKLNRPVKERLKWMESHSDLVAVRDDQTIEYVSLLNINSEYKKAMDVLLSRQFHPWEGGEGKVTGQYIQNKIGMALGALKQKSYKQALNLLTSALTYPNNLGEGKLPLALDNNIHYYLGEVYQLSGKIKAANKEYEKAAIGSGELSSAMFYNDQPPEMVFYQGMARAALGRKEEANMIFNQLVEYGQVHMNDEISINFFAVSLPDFLVFNDDLKARNQIHCRFMKALGHLGLGEVELAIQEMTKAIELDPSNSTIQFHLRLASGSLY